MTHHDFVPIHPSAMGGINPSPWKGHRESRLAHKCACVILIHASKRKNKKEINESLVWCKSAGARLKQPLIADNLSFGCIVGHVNLVDCVDNSSSPWFLGRYGFVLRDPVAYAKPIPYRGQLGFFNVPDFDFRLL